MGLAISRQVCSWCLGDMRPVEGAPAVMVCVYCGRAVSFTSDVSPASLRTLPRLADGRPAAAERTAAGAGVRHAA